MSLSKREEVLLARVTKEITKKKDAEQKRRDLMEIKKFAAILLKSLERKNRKEIETIFRKSLVLKQALDEQKPIKCIILNGKMYENIMIKEGDNVIFIGVAGEEEITFDVIEENVMEIFP